MLIDLRVPERRKIALTGGIATGKSTVAHMFAEMGAVVADADLAARNAVRPGSPCLERLKNRIGPDYFEPGGGLDRRKLRERIIADGQCRKDVESILHPAVMDELEREGRDALRSQPHRPVIFDIPLLFEAGFAPRFDVVILVYVPQDIQILRLMLRDGLTPDEAERTLHMQWPIDSKLPLSDIIIDNSLDPECTRHRVEAVWEELFGRLQPASA